MRTVAVAGTELAPLEPGSGALERSVLSWAAGLGSGFAVAFLDASENRGLPAEELSALRPDLLVLNNRPLWAERLPAGSPPVLHVLHNYEDAWGAGSEDDGRVREVLGRGRVAAVSPTLARHVRKRYALARPVAVVPAGVDSCFFEAEWTSGGAGPPLALFPNRLLEKKGVLLFLGVSRLLAPLGWRCVAFRHLAPWAAPTPEHSRLLAAIAGAPSVELAEAPSTREEMASWYARAAVALCPSTRPEGLGLSALEAQAVGTPVVTSGLGGLADATLSPNETLATFEAAPWAAAALRAACRGSCRRAREAVRQGWGEAGRAAFLATVEGAID